MHIVFKGVHRFGFLNVYANGAIDVVDRHRAYLDASLLGCYNGAFDCCIGDTRSPHLLTFLVGRLDRRDLDRLPVLPSLCVEFLLARAGEPRPPALSCKAMTGDMVLRAIGLRVGRVAIVLAERAHIMLAFELLGDRRMVCHICDVRKSIGDKSPRQAEWGKISLFLNLHQHEGGRRTGRSRKQRVD